MTAIYLDPKCKVVYSNLTPLEGQIIGRAYIRCSTDMQVEDGFSIETQASRISEYCKQNNIFVKAVYYDLGISGAKGRKDRKSYGQLLDDIKKGEAIVCTEQNRLSRSIEESVMLAKKLTDSGISLHIIHLGGDVTGRSRFMFDIMAALAAEERRTISERVKAGMKFLKDNDQLKKCPSFQETSPGKKIPNENVEERMIIVKFIKDQIHSDSRITDAEITRRLNSNFDSEKYGSKSFTQTFVRRLIKRNSLR